MAAPPLKTNDQEAGILAFGGAGDTAGLAPVFRSPAMGLALKADRKGVNLCLWPTPQDQGQGRGEPRDLLRHSCLRSELPVAHPALVAHLEAHRVSLPSNRLTQRSEHLEEMLITRSRF